MKMEGKNHPEKMMKDLRMFISPNYISRTQCGIKRTQYKWGCVCFNYNYHMEIDMPGMVFLSEMLGFYIDSGRNLFDISNHLVRLLHDTEVDIDCVRDIKLPYECFCLQFEMHGEITGAYISRKQLPAHIGNGTEVDIRVISSVTYGYYLSFWIQFDDNGNQIGRENFEGWECYPELVAKEEKILQLVLNMLFYLSLDKKDVVEKYPDGIPQHLLLAVKKAATNRKKEVAEQAIKQAGYCKVKYVGQSFTALATGMGGEKSTHWRRGHWRKHAKGAGYKERELKWIMPMIIRGDKGKPQTGHVYEV